MILFKKQRRQDEVPRTAAVGKENGFKCEIGNEQQTEGEEEELWKIDRICFLAFSAGFLVFNVIYWAVM